MFATAGLFLLLYAFAVIVEGWVEQEALYRLDQAAHRGALSGGGVTAAVLACGVDRAYPVAHERLLKHLAEHALALMMSLARKIPQSEDLRALLPHGWPTGVTVERVDPTARGREQILPARLPRRIGVLALQSMRQRDFAEACLHDKPLRAPGEAENGSGMALDWGLVVYDRADLP